MRFEHRTFRWNDGEDHSRYEAVESTDAVPACYRDAEGQLQVLPQDHGFDGAFAARLRRAS